MKAMRAQQFGGPEQLRFEDAPDPEMGAGQVRIRVRAAGINPADLVRLSGRLQPLQLPYIPGTDVCGEVEAVGTGVTQVKEGDRVFGRAASGGYAEKTCLLASEAIPLPATHVKLDRDILWPPAREARWGAGTSSPEASG